MADQSGLTIDQVRNQWQESERLLDEVRLRLDSVATAREAADRARAGIEDSRDEIRALSANLADALAGLQQTLQAAGSALEGMVKTAEASEPGRLLAAISDTTDQIRELRAGNSRLEETIQTLSSRVAGTTAAIEALQTSTDGRAAAAEQAAEEARGETAALRAKVANAVQSLPGRHQARLSAALAQD